MTNSNLERKATILRNRANTALEKGLIERSLNLWCELIDTYVEMYSEEDKGTLFATGEAAKALEKLERYEEAITYWQRSMKISSSLNSGSLANQYFLNRIAECFFKLGRYTEASEYYRNNIKFLEGGQQENQEALVICKKRLSDCLFSLGKPEAEKIGREAIKLARKCSGKRSELTQSALETLGRNLLYQGNSNGALPLLKEAHSIAKKLYGTNHGRTRYNYDLLQRCQHKKKSWHRGKKNSRQKYF